MHWQQKEWLTLSEVAQLLGVHPSTVRIWANRGKIPVHRTRGGHRRFRRDELELWLMARQQENELNIPNDFAQATLRQVRMRADSGQMAEQPWYAKLQKQDRQDYAREGQKMLQSLWSILITDDNEVLQAEARSLGYDYALQGRKHNLTVGEALSAFLFFANALLDGVLEVIYNSNAPSPRAWAAMLRRIKNFIIYTANAMIEVYEAHEHEIPTSTNGVDQ